MILLWGLRHPRWIQGLPHMCHQNHRPRSQRRLRPLTIFSDKSRLLQWLYSPFSCGATVVGDSVPATCVSPASVYLSAPSPKGTKNMFLTEELAKCKSFSSILHRSGAHSARLPPRLQPAERLDVSSQVGIASALSTSVRGQVKQSYIRSIYQALELPAGNPPSRGIIRLEHRKIKIFKKFL